MIYSLDLNERRDQTARMIRKLLGQRVEIRFAGELGLKCDGGLGGFTSAGLHSLVAESRPDLHRGPVPTVVIVDNFLRDGSIPHGHVAGWFDAIVLHEISHIVEAGESAETAPNDDPAQLRELASTPWRTWPAYASLPKWAGHGARYIRTLLHLRHRLASRGHAVSLEMAFCSAAYGLSRIEDYRISLGDEPARNDWRRMADVLAEPVPEEFKNLWSDDVVRSFSACS